MATYTPREYAEQVWHGKVTPKTVRNWIKNGKLPEGTVVEFTPTNRAIIKVLDKPESKIDKLVAMMEAKYSGSKAA